MKQVTQSLRTGETIIAEVPCPRPGDGQVLIATSASLISAGTERMLVDFGKSNWIERARQQPDKVRMVIDKVRTDGLLATLDAIESKLDQPLALGYCNAGRVIEVGTGVTAFAPGDRVVSNGKHAEIVSVASNLCARIPDGVADESAAFAPLAAISLQGIRLAAPTLGEVFTVSGLGLLGLLSVQILRANGCKVIGADFDPGRLEIARSLGAITVDLANAGQLEQIAKRESGGRGVDGVIICAATESNEPVHQAATICRKRGRIVLVGVTGLELSRADFYEKELSFQVSCSYGPGRYDPEYEQKGQDYPAGFVRWTAQRNIEAVLSLIAQGALDTSALVTHRFPQERAADAYSLLAGDKPSLGIVLQYSGAFAQEIPQTMRRVQHSQVTRTDGAVIGFIGAGNHALRALMPAFQRTGARLKAVASSGGLSATHSAKKFGFEVSLTDVDELLADPEINTVVIATRHGSHADLTIRALEHGKNVFVEKPLALSREELSRLEAMWSASQSRHQRPLLSVGFNRRFAPHIRKMKSLLDSMSAPKVFMMTVNAGEIPADHWTQDPDDGGGRIIGEACHFLDLLRFLAAARIGESNIMALGNATARGNSDNVVITLRFTDGSFGTIHYLANGHRSFPKERLEVFSGGRILTLTNFRSLAGIGWPGFSRVNSWRQDKGGNACAAAFIDAVRSGGPPPIPVEELFEIALVTVELAERARVFPAAHHDGT